MRRAFGTTASPGASLAIALPLPVLIATFCLFWSSAFSVTKLALADCPPLLLLTARFLVAGVVILGAAAVTGTIWRTVTRRDLIVLAALPTTRSISVSFMLGCAAFRRVYRR